MVDNLSFAMLEMQPHGQFDAGVDAALKRAEPGRPGRLRVRSLAARGLAVVLLAAFAALLALPLQAQAQNAGICGRTEAVRNELVALIPVSECALVTDAHLAAITGELYLDNKGITTLAAGDFDGLTALEMLWLYENELAELPAGVFAGLTALEILDLEDNALTTLPAGVFDGLTALEELYLRYNDLSTLPDDVFEPLTKMTRLYLSDNDGAPFSPTADAVPDDGTVSNAGGTVTLDGSGSDGGPWGTNVTYRWALTDPTSGGDV